MDALDISGIDRVRHGQKFFDDNDLTGESTSTEHRTSNNRKETKETHHTHSCQNKEEWQQPGGSGLHWCKSLVPAKKRSAAEDEEKDAEEVHFTIDRGRNKMCKMSSHDEIHHRRQKETNQRRIAAAGKRKHKGILGCSLSDD